MVKVDNVEGMTYAEMKAMLDIYRKMFSKDEGKIEDPDFPNIEISL